jgi:hypothetical protein
MEPAGIIPPILRMMPMVLRSSSRGLWITISFLRVIIVINMSGLQSMSSFPRLITGFTPCDWSRAMLRFSRSASLCCWSVSSVRMQRPLLQPTVRHKQSQMPVLLQQRQPWCGWWFPQEALSCSCYCTVTELSKQSRHMMGCRRHLAIQTVVIHTGGPVCCTVVFQGVA